MHCSLGSAGTRVGSLRANLMRRHAQMSRSKSSIRSPLEVYRAAWSVYKTERNVRIVIERFKALS